MELLRRIKRAVAAFRVEPLSESITPPLVHREKPTVPEYNTNHGDAQRDLFYQMFQILLVLYVTEAPSTRSFINPELLEEMRDVLTRTHVLYGLQDTWEEILDLCQQKESPL